MVHLIQLEEAVTESYLVVAGGGGGAGQNNSARGGGGGAGGFSEGIETSAPSGPSSPLQVNCIRINSNSYHPYPVTVGSGGGTPGGPSGGCGSPAQGGDGSNSIF